MSDSRGVGAAREGPYLNGQKVSDRVLDPAATDYDKRVLYVTHDVTGRLNKGRNALGVMLGNGWYSEPRRLRYGDSPRVLLQMQIEHADGSTASVTSDPTWKTIDGPIRRNDFWNGEVYDARLERPGWTMPGHDDSKWAAAAVKQSPGNEQFISRETPPPLVWTGYYYRGASVVSQAAQLLGKTEDAKHCAELADQIKRAFNRKWLNRETHQYATGSQTANLLPLALQIVPQDQRSGVLKNIVDSIARQYDGHLHTGNTGTTCGRAGHANPSRPVDGIYPAMFAVRDLASGMELDWLPVPDETARTTRDALLALFVEFGPPLVLKSDNGSAFKAEVIDLLADWRVVPLPSPPEMPEYNGSREAGIGALKNRTRLQAALARHPGISTSDDTDAARRHVNELHYRNGHNQPNARDVWQSRSPIDQTERDRFLLTVQHIRSQIQEAMDPALSSCQ